MIQLNSELVEADRLKSEFIESASHELRGPLTAVNGVVHVLDTQLSGAATVDDDTRKLLDIATTGTSRLVELVNDLLDMTRIEAGGVDINKEEVDLFELTSRTVKSSRRLPKRGA